VLRRPDLLRLIGPTLAAPFADQAIAVVCAPEERGPTHGPLVAAELGAGLMVVSTRNGIPERSSGDLARMFTNQTT